MIKNTLIFIFSLFFLAGCSFFSASSYYTEINNLSKKSTILMDSLMVTFLTNNEKSANKLIEFKKNYISLIKEAKSYGSFLGDYTLRDAMISSLESSYQFLLKDITMFINNSNTSKNIKNMEDELIKLNKSFLRVQKINENFKNKLKEFKKINNI
jgi:hypothetical protein